MIQVLFIGDSITEGLNTKRYFSDYKVINKGISGNNADDVFERLEPEWIKGNDYIFLCIGTNDLAQEKSINYISGSIQKIIEFIKKYSLGAKFILLPVFPTRDNEPRPNEAIDKLNDELKKTALKENIGFRDYSDEFKDESGKLKAEFTWDGLHLTKKAYILWSEKLKEIITE